MREIQVQKLTKDNFGKYGEFLDLLDESELKKKSIFQEGFFADVVALEFNQGNQPTISVCHVKKQSENIISFLEAHQYAWNLQVCGCYLLTKRILFLSNGM